MNRFMTSGLALWFITAATPLLAVDTRAAEDALNMQPRFVGLESDDVPLNQSIQPEMLYSYMTASEMQSKVRSLTGYIHPAFIVYADVLGRYDSTTGLRTNDRPSLITVFFIQKIADSVATAVLQRELFLDDDERIVFKGVDLSVTPSNQDLENVIVGLNERWLGQTPGTVTMTQLEAGFRQVEQAAGDSVAAYTWLTGMMIRHGGLYYY